MLTLYQVIPMQYVDMQYTLYQVIPMQYVDIIPGNTNAIC